MTDIQTLYIFFLTSLMSWEISIHLWNHKYNLCHKHIHYLQKFPQNFLLKYSWFTMLYQYLGVFSFLFFSFIFLSVTLFICFIFLYSRFLLVIYFMHISVYMSIPISQFILPHTPPLSLLGVHTFFLYICLSISP